MTKMTHVGLDVHKGTIAIAKLRPDSDTPLVWEIPNEPKAVRKRVREDALRGPRAQVLL
jgi:hypothetical protein